MKHTVLLFTVLLTRTALLLAPPGMLHGAEVTDLLARCVVTKTKWGSPIRIEQAGRQL